ncbi:MAG: hypothetical protein NEHIOOID_01235 [Holosporales bacterium]
MNASVRGSLFQRLQGIQEQESKAKVSPYYQKASILLNHPHLTDYEQNAYIFVQEPDPLLQFLKRHFHHPFETIMWRHHQQNCLEQYIFHVILGLNCAIHLFLFDANILIFYSFLLLHLIRPFFQESNNHKNLSGTLPNTDPIEIANLHFLLPK